MDTLTPPLTDVIMLSIVNSFDSVFELQRWAYENGLLQDDAVQARLRFLSGPKRYRCDYCSQTFNQVVSLKRHVKLRHELQQHAKDFHCNVCFQKFQCVNRLYVHRAACCAKICHICHASFASSELLRTHMNEHSSDNVLTQYTCHDCGSVHDGLRALYIHRDMMHGGADVPPLQRPPWDVPPWIREDGSIDEEFQQVYVANERHILRNHRRSNHTHIYNFPTNDLQGGIQELSEHLEYIFLEQRRTFKVNISFGLILRRISDDPPSDNPPSSDPNNSDELDEAEQRGRYRYFIPYRNSNVFPHPFLISDRHDIFKLINKLKQLDIEQYMRQHRPNTKWKLYFIPNMNFIVYQTKFALGAGALPEFIHNNRHIRSFDSSPSTGRPYTDFLCFFRCLSFHRTQKLTSIRSLYMQWRNYKGSANVPISMQDFRGVDLSEMHEIEKCFGVSIRIYSLSSEGAATPVFSSLSDYKDVMYLNLYEKHLSYITSFQHYARKFACPMCSRHFAKRALLKKHMRHCIRGTRLNFPGGFHSQKKTIFDRLSEYGIDVTESLQLYDWFIVYDFEAVLNSKNDQVTENLLWQNEHVPISVSVASNYTEFTDPHCIVDEDPEVLLEKFLAYLNDIAAKIQAEAFQKWEHVQIALSSLIAKWQKLNQRENVGEQEFVDFCELGCLDDDDDDDQMLEEQEGEDVGAEHGSGRRFSCKLMLKKLINLQNDFLKYCSQVPVLGFNSSRYDINLIKGYFISRLESASDKPTEIIKKNSAYASISVENFIFLDVSHFLAPGSSYSKFLKAFGIVEKKSFFPYEWLTSADKLQQQYLPSYEEFYSSLKKANVLEMEYSRWDGKGDAPPTGQENYEHLKQIWLELNMTTMKDFLVYYNNLDVGPFVLAVEKMKNFYCDLGVDPFKNAISVPGIARQLLFRTAKENNAYFALFGNQDMDLYYTLRKNIVGGPSIIFTRHHEVGSTLIRGDKVCQSIVGYDANALYLWALAQPMPTGIYVRRKFEDDFLPKLPLKYIRMYFWMEYLIQMENRDISHKMNSGQETRIGPYLVDGFEASSKTVFEFDGCFFHGHAPEQCCLNRNCNPKLLSQLKQRRERTMERRQFLENMGYSVESIWECEYKEQYENAPLMDEVKLKLLPSFYSCNPGKLTQHAITTAVISGDLFGVVEVDIQVPEEWSGEVKQDMPPWQYFSEMSPLFCTVDIPFEAIGEHMRDHAISHNLSQESRRLLVGGMKARKMLIATPLLRWYLQHGLTVTHIYQIIEFSPATCFKPFQESVTKARRGGDENEHMEIIGESMKLVGNAAFGSVLMEKTKHQSIKIAKTENELLVKINDPLFRQMTKLSENCYEVVLGKKNITLDIPIQVGFFVLQYAKQHMLSFYYDFMDTYVERSNFQYIEMDTDSAYMALSTRTLADAIKPEKRDEFNHILKQRCDESEYIADENEVWFPRTCCKKHSKFDNRTPGLFKEEATGQKMVALSSKCYLLKQGDRCKISCKGVNKCCLDNPLEIFTSVLETKNSFQNVNRGIRVRNGTVFSYEQQKNGFSYFYCKRKVLEDGVTTEPLDIVLSPVNDANMIIFDSRGPLSPFHIYDFTYGGIKFSCIYQCFLYQKAYYHSQRIFFQDILSTSSENKLTEIDKVITVSSHWNILAEETLFNICKDKMFQCQQVLFLLKDMGSKQMYYANEIDLWMGCGLPESLIRLMNPDSFPGRNILGQVWRKLSHSCNGAPQEDSS